MATILGAAAIDFIKTVVEKVIPDPAAKATALLEIERLHQSGELAQLQADTDLSKGQMDINKVEAASANLFVSGWRPWIGWVCGSAFAYHLIIQPLLAFIMAAYGHIFPLPDFDTATLNTTLMGLLGLGGLRTLEKIRGVS